ncbi:MAG: flavodoxin [Candidatus Cloacimonetes bacterium]|nr:flavodoxin [Candidatus Cloacimonadota bacterium]
MKIGILYHSETGNTERFAQSLADAMIKAGHTVNSTKLQTVNPVKKASVRDSQTINFSNLPDLSSFDLILFGGPVWAFGPSPAIIAAIKQCSGLQGKSAMPFATMGFPIRFLGGTSALHQMSKELAAKGARVLPGKVCRQMMNKLESDIGVAVHNILNRIK